MTAKRSRSPFPDLERSSGERPPLEVGVELTEEYTVEGGLLTDVGGTLTSAVLSTPAMIAIMERTAATIAYERLPEGSASVGFEVCVKHVGGAPEGARCRSRAKLIEIVDGRKLFFEVEVRHDDRVIGVGTHQRRVIQIAPPADG